MRIKYFKLTNFAGIKYGINSNILELTDIPNGIVILQGDNGCGKSTTLKTLHIFSDDKDYLIKKEDETFEPASKELIVEHNGIDYHIVHQYNAKGSKKSFIKKNDEELNANGNVSTFEDVIYKEFGFENNTISNTVIGVSSINFIDLTSSKRKEEIASLLPNILDYEKAFKNVNEGTLAQKKQIQAFSNLISEGGGSEEINKNIEFIKEKIKPIEENLKILNETNLDLKTQMAVIDNNISNTKSEYNEINNKLNNNKQKYEEALRILNKLESKNIDNSELDLNVINSKQEVANNNIQIKLNEKKELETKISQMNFEWSSYMKDLNHNKQIETSRNMIKKNIDDISLEINQIIEDINKVSSINVKSYYTKDISELISNVGISIKNEISELNSGYTYDIDEKNVFDLYEDINMIMKKKESYLEKRTELDSIIHNINLFSNINNRVNSNQNSDSIKMTDGCSLSKCSMQYNFILKELSDKKQKYEDFLNKNEDKFNQYCVFLEIYNRYKTFTNQRIELFKILNIEYNLSNNNSSISLRNYEELLSKLRDYKKEIESSLSMINIIPEKKQLLSQKETNLTRYKQDLENTKLLDLKNPDFNIEDIKLLEESVSLKDTEILSINKKLNSLKEQMNLAIEYSKLDQYKNFIEKYNDGLEKNKEILTKLNNFESEKNILNNSIITNNSLIENNTNSVKTLYSELKTLEDKLLVIDNYILQKNSIESELELRNMVLGALNTKKGIPALLIKEYLIKIERSCNEILDKAFNGSYQIYLDNLEKDFFIRVYEKSTDRYIKDVLLCSSGQQAIIKLVLSIALNKCAINDNSTYLKLDECDSVLSKENLAMIEVLLNSLLNKFGIEQVFIVTHNSSVSVADMKIYFDRIDMTYDIERLN